MTDRSPRGAEDDRRTPRELWGPLDEEFGFTLDVAASADNALTPRYYDREADGLSKPWSGVVWCNPPYSNIRAWVKKAHTDIGWRSDVIVMLLPANRTEQSWWQDYIEPYQRSGKIEIRFLRGRLRFDTPDHEPPFGCVLVIWRSA